ncbi:hypothetical protein M8J76_006431 [Diaphorina citri]|nr:hypothetical protein M8J75_004387 [Diaphorina citri]KAI5722292.1 hypothetical protein M8J76_006431 [Diaphorina citri]
MKISIVFMLICIAITTTSASPLFKNWQERADINSWSNLSSLLNRFRKFSLGKNAKEPFYKKFWFVKKLQKYFASRREQRETNKSKDLYERVKKQYFRQLQEDGIEERLRGTTRNPLFPPDISEEWWPPTITYARKEKFRYRDNHRSHYKRKR